MTQVQWDQERVYWRERIENQQNLKKEFEDLSAQVMLKNNNSFLDLAKQTLEGHMIHPIQKTLAQVDEKLALMEKERLTAYVDLKRQVHDLIGAQNLLRGETANLAKALRSPNSRGQWGEIQLKRVVEMAGMLNHCDFIEQERLDHGRLRPDMVIRLPGKKCIVVDAKTPLQAYLEAQEMTDENLKREKLDQHAQHLRAHIKTLSQRAYFEQFESSPEFVILFLPGEAFFSAALERDPSLIEYGVQEKVILATPTTLIALLRSVSYGWRHESMAENVKVMGELGKELYKRLCDMSGHFSKLGRQIGQSVDTFNQVAGSFERRVLVSARKMSELDVVMMQDTIETPALLDTAPRTVQDQTFEDEKIPHIPRIDT